VRGLEFFVGIGAPLKVKALSTCYTTPASNVRS